MAKKLALASLLMLFLLALLLEAQRFSFFPPEPKDTEFIFARIWFSSGRGFSNFGWRAGWAHDYPDAEEHILQIANEATSCKSPMKPPGSTCT